MSWLSWLTCKVLSLLLDFFLPRPSWIPTLQPLQTLARLSMTGVPDSSSHAESNMASTSESSPLLPQYQNPEDSNTSPRGNRPPRTVTFNPLATVSTYGGTTAADPTFRPLHTGSPPAQNVHAHVIQQRPGGLSTLNSKIRRRNSYGSTQTQSVHSGSKVGPQRTTKNAQKLKLLPDPVTAAEEEGVEGDFPRDVYSQITRIKEPTARSHAARLGKADRERLPRVTTYCTANSYQLDGVVRFLKSRSKTRGANPKLFDECVYSPYDYQYEERKEDPRLFSGNGINVDGSHAQERPPGERRFSDSAVEIDDNQFRRGNLIDIQESESDQPSGEGTSEAVATMSQSEEIQDFDTTIHTPEVFLFDYGTVVIWGMSQRTSHGFYQTYPNSQPPS